MIGRSALALARAYENDDGNSATNGEFRILDALRTADISTVFDVGAHHGEWAEYAARAFPGARVWAFEIEPSARAELERRVRGNRRVTVVPFGLADKSGELVVHVDKSHPMMTSAVNWDADRREPVLCRVESGDAFLASQGIDRIDFLKVDVEGLDHSVLRGLTRSLADERVGIIQFEFTQWAAITKTALRDFYELLEPAGFTIGKVFPTFVDWRAYALEHEIYVRANFLAVHRSRRSVIELLG